MAWSDAARAASAEARRMHARAHETPLQREYRKASKKNKARMGRNIAMNTSPTGYRDAIYRRMSALIHKN